MAAKKPAKKVAPKAVKTKPVATKAKVFAKKPATKLGKI